jgi:hypothetical protein
VWLFAKFAPLTSADIPVLKVKRLLSKKTANVRNRPEPDINRFSGMPAPSLM